MVSSSVGAGGGVGADSSNVGAEGAGGGVGSGGAVGAGGGVGADGISYAKAGATLKKRSDIIDITAKVFLNSFIIFLTFNFYWEGGL